MTLHNDFIEVPPQKFDIKILLFKFFKIFGKDLITEKVLVIRKFVWLCDGNLFFFKWSMKFFVG